MARAGCRWNSKCRWQEDRNQCLLHSKYHLANPILLSHKATLKEGTDNTSHMGQDLSKVTDSLSFLCGSPPRIHVGKVSIHMGTKRKRKIVSHINWQWCPSLRQAAPQRNLMLKLWFPKKIPGCCAVQELCALILSLWLQSLPICDIDNCWDESMRKSVYSEWTEPGSYMCGFYPEWEHDRETQLVYCTLSQTILTLKMSNKCIFLSSQEILF